MNNKEIEAAYWRGESWAIKAVEKAANATFHAEHDAMKLRNRNSKVLAIRKYFYPFAE